MKDHANELMHDTCVHSLDLLNRWVNSPPCDNCGSGTNDNGMGTALPSEAKYGGFRVELYK